MGKLIYTAVVVMALFAVMVSGSEDLKEKMKRDLDDCKRETGATDDDVKSFMKMGDELSSEAECFVGCVYEKYGILVNGVFSKENSEQWIAKRFSENKEKQEKARMFIDRCEQELATVPPNKCSTGPALRKCIKRIFQQIMAAKQQQ